MMHNEIWTTNETIQIIVTEDSSKDSHHPCIGACPTVLGA